MSNQTLLEIRGLKTHFSPDMAKCLLLTAWILQCRQERLLASWENRAAAKA